ncbi:MULTISPECIES: ATP-dependent zinc protease family protein [Shewanella]|uniref:ATP-dependent zinc protease n=2 Tax=Shewanella TaxID=22 RepID=A0A974XIS7_9GAMM|nr:MULTISPECIES: RimK/LysX family protein [Shewanella]QSX29151.1 ATP-dependent zinc protease [Shewanella cyperi]QSX36294.1 ATP-dependent zinc protease [Shewanella sedimentimangrovi]QSX39896.1 ATP-dependent zinc protease [Shewanella cyperi]
MTAASLPVIGWREWGILPDVGNERVKIKIDTGAKTSCLHAFKIKPFYRDKVKWVEIWLHPEQKSSRAVRCEFPVHDRRLVTDSGGHKQLRYVIKTCLVLGAHQFELELTLSRRDNMRFRMLLGRRALNGRFLVDPAASYLTGVD